MKPYVEAFIAAQSRELLRTRMMGWCHAYKGRVPGPLQRLFFIAIKDERFRADYPYLSPWEMVEVLKETIGVPFIPKYERTPEYDEEERVLLDPTAPMVWPTAPAPDASPAAAPGQ